MGNSILTGKHKIVIFFVFVNRSIQWNDMEQLIKGEETEEIITISNALPWSFTEYHSQIV